ncbi:hypothetical protein O2313_05375 [Bacillus amyloliquefaciens]|uniref:ATP-dependent DNA ligase n=1 Tax=Bacillus amyloliquefaciens TaxID=1390 RepID=UPI0022AF10B0|nr:hypothetical protein [Bacillus amyloliquefaciens]MCZ4246963.1 hypothetical protein [Bacillus amyloliquefaciens]
MNNGYPLDEILLPMGGTTVKDQRKMDELWENDNYVAEEKYDGSRYLSIGGRFFSRHVSVVTKLPVEKTANVPHLNKVLSDYPLLILDGEVYIEGGKSSDVVSIMGSSPEKAVARQEERGYVNFVAYDILRDMDGNWLTDLPWIDRRGILEEQMELIFTDHPDTTHISISKYVKHNKKEYNAEIMRRGGEGVTLKNINGKYHPDKKPRWNWIKVKQEITSDVIITGFKEPVREYTGEELDNWPYWEAEDGILYTLNGQQEAQEECWSNGIKVDPVTRFYFYGWIGAIEFAQYDDKGELKHVGHCSGIRDELRKDMTENSDKYIGTCMEISAMERTKDGYFRHPQFLRLRPDKNAKDCVINED